MVMLSGTIGASRTLMSSPSAAASSSHHLNSL